MVEAVRTLRPDLVVADLSMPVLNGLDALRRIQDARLPTKVIFLTMHADVQLATEALRAGACGYLLKQAAGEELLTTLHKVLLGRVYLTPLILALGQGGASLALVVLLGYWAINGVFSAVLAPRMLGKGLDLSVVLTLVSTLFWIGLLRPTVGILAVPLTLIIKSAIEGSYRGTAWLAVALGDSSKLGETVTTVETPAQA